MAKCKPPSDLDARRNWQFSGRDMQANVADELTGALAFGSPETPASLFNEQLATVGHCVTFIACKRGWEKLHDPWVRVQRGERFAVSKPPLP
jgi:hypothetical protein